MEIDLEHIRSEDLVNLRVVFGQYSGLLDIIAPIFQMKVIIDANIVIRDLIWLTKKRKNKEAKTVLQELFESETILAQAPTLLREEVERHIPNVAIDQNIDMALLFEEWAIYSKNIEFHDVSNELASFSRDCQDPDDLPYIILQKKIDAPIRTMDTDIPAMGGNILHYEVIGHLKDYSRNAAIEYTIKYNGLIVANLGSQIVGKVFNFVKELLKKVPNLPQWLLWLAGALILVALLTPVFRKVLVNWIDSITESLKNIGNELLDLTLPFVDAHYSSKTRTENALALAKIKMDKN